MIRLELGRNRARRAAVLAAGLSALALLILCAPPANANTSCVTTGATVWNQADATGNWATAGDWIGGAVPTGSACIDNGGTAAAVSITSSVSVVNLYIDAGSSVNILSGGTITPDGSTFVNSGQINMTAGTNNAEFFINGTTDNLTLSGGGTVTLSTTGTGLAYFTETFAATDTLTNVDNTIQGAGQIGNGSGLLLVNETSGTVDANVTAQALYVNGGGATNTGLFEATNGGTLALQGVVNNQSGTILSSGNSGTTNSFVDLLNGSTIEGGTLNTSGSGTLGTAVGSGATITLDGTTHGALTNSGTFTIADGTSVQTVGSIINSGTINVTAAADGTRIFLTGNTTLSGGGTITLSESGAGAAYFTGTFDGGFTLTNTNNTIQGAGQIGNGSDVVLVNETAGTVDANATAQALYLNGGGVTNTGLLEATNGGTLAVQGAVNNQNGTILSSGNSGTTNSFVDLLNGSTIQGGTLNTAGLGTIGTAAGSSATVTLDGSTDGALTNSGTFIVATTTTTQIGGSIINSGAIDVGAVAAATTSNSTLWVNGNATLSGGGTVTLTNTGSGGSAIITTCFACSPTLTNVNNTIQGAGDIEGGWALDNETTGTVNANTSGQALVFSAVDAITNAGLMEATNGGTLAIYETSVANSGGTIEAGLGTGSTVQFVNTPTISGGNVDGSGQILGTFTLSSGAITPGYLASSTPGTLTVTGAYTQSGGVFNELIGGSSFGVLNVSGLVTISSGTATALDITLASGFVAVDGTHYTILDSTGSTLSGIFSNGSTTMGNFTADGYNWTITYPNGNDAVLILDSPVAATLVTATWGPVSPSANTTGNWTTAGEWSCNTSTPSNCVPNNGTPASTNYAAVLDSAGHTITLDGTSSPTSVTINSLNVEAGEVDVNTGASLTVTGSTTVGSSVDDVVRSGGGTFNVGTLTNLSSGTLTGGGYQAAGGGTLNINGNVTTISGSTTAIIVDGAGSMVANGSADALAGLTNNNGGFLDIYDGATETITPAGGTFSNTGGTVTAAFGGSSLTVDGAFSNTDGNGFGVTVNGTGGGASISVAGNFTNDGLLTSGGATVVTVENGGALNITGAGHSFTNQNDAELFVNTGATMGVSGNFVNQASANVQVNDASLTVGGNLTNQTLAGIVVGNGGSLAVNGAAGVTNSSNITVGSASGETANNTVTVLNTFTNSGTFQLAATVGGNTTQATVGSFSNTGNVNVLSASTLTSNGAFTQTAGGFTTVEGTLTGTGGVNINGGTLDGTGTIPGGGTINGATTIGAGGTLQPGEGGTAGTLTFGGSLTINGTLRETINSGTQGTGYGYLNATGESLTLGSGSVLNLQQLDSYNPAVGLPSSTLTIATAGSLVSGTFGTVLGDTFNGGTEMWDVFYNQGGDNIVLVAADVTVTPTTLTATWGPVSPSANTTGNWTTAGEWSCNTGTPSNCVPNNGTPSNTNYNAVLDSGGHTLTVNTPETINQLTMTAGTLDIATGGALNLASQPGGITDINVNSGLILAGTFEAGSSSALAGLTSVEGSLTLANGTTTTVTPSGGTFSNSGTVNVQAGSTFVVDGGVANSGTVTMQGSDDTLRTTGAFGNTGSVTVGTTETLNANGGYTNSGAGTTDVTGTLNTTTYQHTGGTTTVEAGGDIATTSFNQSGGSVQGNGTIGGNYTQSGGTLTPGLGTTPGTLSLTGAFTQDAGGTLDIDLGGTGAGDFSVLDVTGNVGLGGTVDFTAVGGFDPTVGDDFTFLLFGSDAGATDFSNVVFTNWTCPVDATCTDVFSADSLSLDIAASGPPPVPEPSALPMLAIGLLALVAFYRRKRVRAER